MPSCKRKYTEKQQKLRVNVSGRQKTDSEINRIYDGVEAETRKSQASFQII